MAAKAMTLLGESGTTRSAIAEKGQIALATHFRGSHIGHDDVNADFFVHRDDYRADESRFYVASVIAPLALKRPAIGLENPYEGLPVSRSNSLHAGARSMQRGH